MHGSKIEDKIRHIGQLQRIVSRLKADEKRIVFTNGCFDLLHYGHVRYLQEAKAKGDVLIVGVNTDLSVRRLKGPRRPIVSLHDRMRLLAALASVDYVIAFGEDTPLKLIMALRPDVLIKGADWQREKIAGADLVNRHGGRVATIALVEGRSTTDLIKKIAKSY